MYSPSALTVYGEDNADTPFPRYPGGVWRGADMWGDTEIDVAINRWIRMCYLCFIYLHAITVGLVLGEGEQSCGSHISYLSNCT